MIAARWKRLRDWGRRVVGWDGFWWIIGMVGVLIISGGLSWRYWGDLHGNQDSLSTTIRNLGLVVGGIEAILLAAWRSIVAQRQAVAAHRQADTSHLGLLNERYQRGAEMLGSEVLPVRLGGIYDLERLAAEHPERYHIQVIKLFCAFARNPTDAKRITRSPEPLDDPDDEVHILRADVEDVMRAIGTRGTVGISLEPDPKDEHLLYLRDANLRHLQARDAKLSGAWLPNANLSEARLPSVDLSGARLRNADLSDARLQQANLSRSNLRGAKLQGTNLSATLLWGSDLSGAILRNANLSGADLSGATVHSASYSVPVRGLTQAQLDMACAELQKPPLVKGVLDAETGEPLVWWGKQMVAKNG